MTSIDRKRFICYHYSLVVLSNEANNSSIVRTKYFIIELLALYFIEYTCFKLKTTYEF